MGIALSYQQSRPSADSDPTFDNDRVIASLSEHAGSGPESGECQYVLGVCKYDVG